MTNRAIEILLVDDNDHDNFFHKRAIEKTGLPCDVTVCTTGLDALDYLQGKGQHATAESLVPQPDIIFLDINMPKLSGWGFLEAYEKLPAAQTVTSTVVVMLSTSSSNNDREQAMTSSIVVAFMEKPLRPDTLMSVVEKYVA